MNGPKLPNASHLSVVPDTISIKAKTEIEMDKDELFKKLLELRKQKISEMVVLAQRIPADSLDLELKQVMESTRNEMAVLVRTISEKLGEPTPGECPDPAVHKKEKPDALATIDDAVTKEKTNKILQLGTHLRDLVMAVKNSLSVPSIEQLQTYDELRSDLESRLSMESTEHTVDFVGNQAKEDLAVISNHLVELAADIPMSVARRFRKDAHPQVDWLGTQVDFFASLKRLLDSANRSIPEAVDEAKKDVVSKIRVYRSALSDPKIGIETVTCKAKDKWLGIIPKKEEKSLPPLVADALAPIQKDALGKKWSLFINRIPDLESWLKQMESIDEKRKALNAFVAVVPVKVLTICHDGPTLDKLFEQLRDKKTREKMARYTENEWADAIKLLREQEF